jgi:AraC family transcriptional regulator
MRKSRTIAERSGYCEKQLRNIFKQSMGISPKQYILQLKIDKSCELLEASSLSISQISETFSFSSPYHYTNTFKKMKGVSPTVYRKNHESK